MSQESTMRSPILLVITLALVSGCSAIVNESTNNEVVCWTYVTEKLSNVLNLCVEQNHGSVLVEYPNIGSTPTTCFQTGAKKNIEAGFELSLLTGSCENGKKLANNNVTCIFINQGLDCVDVDGNNFKFGLSQEK